MEAVEGDRKIPLTPLSSSISAMRLSPHFACKFHPMIDLGSTADVNATHITTDLGPVGLLWTEDGLFSLLLGKDKITESIRSSPPLWLHSLCENLKRHLSGQGVPGYARVPLLGGATPFTERVRTACRGIPKGQLRTYGELAVEVGSPGGARAVGQVMRRNPFPLIIPCHRVIGAGRNKWFYSAGGPEMKRALLALEGGDFRLSP
jgi:methylated-DNA-[protein]-cysteine S-methyltransferase